MTVNAGNPAVFHRRRWLALAVTLAVYTMNSNSAVFGLCNPESGYGSPQHYPTSEQLSAFYGGSGGAGGGGGGGGGGSASGGEPDSPSPYGSIHSESRTSVPSVPQPETKYEPNPSHSPTQTAAGIVSSDNGLQYANLDGDMKGYPAGYPSHQSYQAAHHASLVQASYAHHYGTPSTSNIFIFYKGFGSGSRAIFDPEK